MSQALFRLFVGNLPARQRAASCVLARALVSSSACHGGAPAAAAAFHSLVLGGRRENVWMQQKSFTSTRLSSKALASEASDIIEEDEEDLEDVENTEEMEQETDEDNVEFLSTSNPHWLKVGMDPDIIKQLNRRGITSFTPVQGEAFEPIVQGRDVIGRSRTGTGKTLAFGLPSLMRLVDITREKGTRHERSGRMARGRKCSMLILCPTRELARQVSDEISIYARPLGLSVNVFHGGVSYNPQRDAIRDGLDVLVGTPGRIMDHIESGSLDLGECNIAVLDEADEMLNMGFADQVEHVFRGIGTANEEKPQCLMFSATTPKWVKEIGKKYQQDPFSIDSTGDEGGARVATTVRHLAVPVHTKDIHAILEAVILKQLAKEGDSISIGAEGKQHVGKTIIFTDTKREADQLSMGGVFQTLVAQSLHGDHTQGKRDSTLDAFRRGRFNVLIATDVAARGIDIKDVDVVVQLAPPDQADAYVHRSGRTGRAGKNGISILLYGRHQTRQVAWIERDLGHDFSFEMIDPPSVEETLALVGKITANKLKAVPPRSVALYKEMANGMVAESEDPSDVVARCLAVMNERQTQSEEEEEHRHRDGRGGGRGRRGDNNNNRNDSMFGNNHHNHRRGGGGGRDYGQRRDDSRGGGGGGHRQRRNSGDYHGHRGGGGGGGGNRYDSGRGGGRNRKSW